MPADPQAPALISAGATALQLHWPTPPNGGSEITHYILQRDDGWGRSSQTSKILNLLASPCCKQACVVMGQGGP